MAKASKGKSPGSELRDYALGFPGAYEEHPWGESVAKVNKKVFVFLGRGEGDSVGVSVKLQASHGPALSLPFTEPTGYGLGKAGWVSARFSEGEDVPVGILRSWIAESYRLIAPKKLVAQLDGTSKSPAPTKAVRKASTKSGASAKTAAAKSTKTGAIRAAPARKPKTK